MDLLIHIKGSHTTNCITHVEFWYSGNENQAVQEAPNVVLHNLSSFITNCDGKYFTKTHTYRSFVAIPQYHVLPQMHFYFISVSTLDDTSDESGMKAQTIITRKYDKSKE